MFEQDIELAKLLLEKCNTSCERRDQLQAELREYEQQLDEKTAVRQSREGYADIMSKAAALLDRRDLEVAIPDTSDLEIRVLELRDEVETVSQQASQFSELLRELEDRAPAIVAAALGDRLEQAGLPENNTDIETAEEPVMGETETETQPQDEPEQNGITETEEADTPPEETGAESEFEPEPEAEAGSDPGTGEEAADEAAPAVDDSALYDDDPVPASTAPVEEYDAGNLLKRFNLHSLKTKEAFTYGRGAAYVIDASNILERVPNYDLAIRDSEESTIRDELLRDFDQLSRELSGTFYIVFNSWYHPLVTIGNRVAAIYTTGDNEGTREGAHQRIQAVVKDIAGKHRNLCVVTSDDTLANQFRNEEVFVISLGDFFNY